MDEEERAAKIAHVSGLQGSLEARSNGPPLPSPSSQRTSVHHSFAHIVPFVVFLCVVRVLEWFGRRPSRWECRRDNCASTGHHNRCGRSEVRTRLLLFCFCVCLYSMPQLCLQLSSCIPDRRRPHSGRQGPTDDSQWLGTKRPTIWKECEPRKTYSCAGP
jgi:hypothetical protein